MMLVMEALGLMMPAMVTPVMVMLLVMAMVTMVMMMLLLMAMAVMVMVMLLVMAMAVLVMVGVTEEPNRVYCSSSLAGFFTGRAHFPIVSALSLLRDSCNGRRHC